MNHWGRSGWTLVSAALTATNKGNGDFTRPGPAVCNHCTGVLSSHLQCNLATLGLALPDEVIQAEIESNTLQLGEGVLQVERPYAARRILSVFRGEGPRLLQHGATSSFDSFLLSQAHMRGDQIMPKRLRRVLNEPHSILQTPQQDYSADLVNLAIVVNSRSPLDIKTTATNPHHRK